MKNLIVTLLVALTLWGTTSTQYGECQGIATVDNKDPKLKYEPDAWNVVIGVIFFETVFAPILAFGWDPWCPVGSK